MAKKTAIKKSKASKVKTVRISKAKKLKTGKSKGASEKNTIINIGNDMYATDSNTPKSYPVIYTYIYERESQDMRRIFNEHKDAKPDKSKPPKIYGFKVENGQLIPIKSIKRKKSKK